VLGAKTFKKCLDRLRKPVVSRNLRDPAGVAASRRDLQKSENGNTRSLVLVGDVGVIADGRQLVGFVTGTIFVVGAEIDVVKFEMVFDVGANGLGRSAFAYSR
jgi:hypothetical protein